MSRIISQRKPLRYASRLLSEAEQDVAANGVKALLLLAWPVVLSRSTQAVIGFCDALMTAPIGEEALAATTTGAMNTFAAVVLAMGTVFIVQSFASQLKGRGDPTAARHYAWYGLILAVIAAMVALFAIPVVGPALSVFDYEPSVHRLMTDYMSIRLFAVGAIMGVEVLGNWYGGMGNTRVQMIAGVVTMVLNIFLNWVLIYGKLGAPALGVEGAALASTIASWSGFVVIGLFFALRRGAEFTNQRVQLRAIEFWRMLRFGIPNGINWFLEFAAFVIFINVVVADLGTVVLAAMMVVIEINSVSFMPSFGLSSAGAILVGQAIGRGDRDAVPKIVRTTVIVAIIWQVSIGLSYLFFPDTLVGWFSPPTANAEELVSVGVVLLLISVAWQLFDAMGMALAEALRAAGDTAWCMWARIAIAWLMFVPAAYVSVNIYGGGPAAAMLSFVFYLVMLSLAFLWRFRRGTWRRIDLTGMEEELPT